MIRCALQTEIVFSSVWQYEVYKNMRLEDLGRIMEASLGRYDHRRQKTIDFQYGFQNVNRITLEMSVIGVRMILITR